MPLALEPLLLGSHAVRIQRRLLRSLRLSGHTFCTVEEFGNVANAVAECAFKTANLPVILSLEVIAAHKRRKIRIRVCLHPPRGYPVQPVVLCARCNVVDALPPCKPAPALQTDGGALCRTIAYGVRQPGLARSFRRTECRTNPHVMLRRPWIESAVVLPLSTMSWLPLGELLACRPWTCNIG
jgi:hypothetical protein